MRECTFHLPIAFNDGKDGMEIVNACLSEVSNVFGGATVTEGKGYWVHNGKLFCEDVYRITVALDEWKEHILFDIAMRYAKRLEQLALYFVHANGKAKIYDCVEQVEEQVA